jgi:hypothetical protein
MPELFDKTWFRCVVNVFVICVLAKWLYKVFWRRAHAAELENKDNDFFAPTTLSIRPEGLKLTSPKTTLTAEWSAIESIQVTRDYIMFYVDKSSAFLLAKRDIGDEQRTRTLLQVARKYLSDAREA